MFNENWHLNIFIYQPTSVEINLELKLSKYLITMGHMNTFKFSPATILSKNRKLLK